MKGLTLVFVLIVCGWMTGLTQSVQRHKIAIFTPLYLDSLFDDGGNYKADKTIPKYINAGLEFYEGAQMALDSLEKRAAPLEVFVYDIKAKEPLYQQLNKLELKDVELIIGQSNAVETRILADMALRRKIPFISATLPNDAGITNNPYVVILNSTLQTHVEGIYRYLQRFHSLDKIIVFRKNGTQEDQIRNYFNEFSRTTVSTPLNIQFVNIDKDMSAKTLASYLDPVKKNVCISGSLDEEFGIQLLKQLATLNKTYQLTVFGMPTWDNITFSRNEYSDIEILYSTPFYYNRATPVENEVATDFNSRYNTHATEMLFRGYESTLRFALLLLDAKKDITSSLSRKGNTIFTQFDIQPVFKDKKTMNLDYFENKHLYFVKVLGGIKNIMY
jgi:ABC-type branched-subunit amino acid transport system substrate-binding protein